MTNLPHVIETALLILIAFLIGCVLGYFLRLLFTAPGGKNVPATSDKSDVSASAVVAEAVVAPKPEPVASSAEKAVAAKPAPKKRSPAKSATSKSTSAVVKPAAKKAGSGKVSKTTSATTSATAQGLDAKPALLSEPRAGGKDDLKKIKGIGPKIETTLNELGVFHFDQIATWNKASIDWVNDYLSFKGRVERENWVTQAKALSGTKA